MAQSLRRKSEGNVGYHWKILIIVKKYCCCIFREDFEMCNKDICSSKRKTSVDRGQSRALWELGMGDTRRMKAWVDIYR